jgi:Na+/H+ antiporter NhaD/arsenite permease-like protein
MSATGFGIPVELILFAATLVGVAIFTGRAFTVAIIGVAIITIYKLAFSGFDEGAGFVGLFRHLSDEWSVLTNLGLLLTGFAILSRHFEQSRLPDAAPNFLPDGWLGGLTLLALVFAVSSFLDNIAAALIGATVAAHVYRRRVHIAFLAAIVAAANAGGAGSVIGDTTTTMRWIAGKSPLDVLHGYAGSIAAFAIFGVVAALAQERHQPILELDRSNYRLDGARLAIAAFILVTIVAANVAVTLFAPHMAARVPVLGTALWLAIGASAIVRQPDWSILGGAAKGALFLLALVFSASLMPVEALPPASWTTTLGLGFVSAIFDNIPLTALALRQGGYDWGLLAYAVGFGGSMIWFGSSAGVAVASLFPEARSTARWLRYAWWLVPAYAVGFFFALAILGWRPSP